MNIEKSIISIYCTS